MTDDDLELARRELCPDGSCIGLIGPDGRCKVCGAVGASAVSDPRHRGMRPPAGDDEARGDDGSADLDTDRELCPDGACVGVIGPDGRCKVCGTRGMDGVATARPAADASPQEPSARPRPADEAIEVDDDEDRELCPDGSCLGLIGPDGKCKVCGTARPSPPS
jgi:hypothetical protein